MVFPRWPRLGILFCLGLLLGLLLHPLPIGIGRVAIAQSPSTPELVQQGVQQFQRGDFAAAVATWKQALAQATQAKDRAVIHNNLAQVYRQQGQLPQAIAEWEQAIQIYRQLGDAAPSLAPVLLEQAQTYSELGQNRRTIPLFEAALKLAQQQKQTRLAAIAQGGLGDAYTTLGDYDQALQAYQTSIALAEPLKQRDYLTIVRNNLGNLHLQWVERYRYQLNAARLEGDSAEEARLTRLMQQSLSAARQAYDQSWQDSQTVGPLAEATALLNLNRFLEQFSLAIERDRVAQNRDRIPTLLAAEPNTRAKAYALINLARSLQTTPLSDRDATQSRTLLEQALAIARALGDARTASFALGGLGHWEEVNKRYPQALDWTQQAQLAAQQVDAAESLYLWQWQAGRILTVTGEKPRAIAAYEQAIANLQRIRGDIISANRDLQFNFRDSVEPVYRELIGLLLDRPEPAPKLKAQTKATPGATVNIRKVLDTLELLKLAELQNFFGDECVEVASNRVEQAQAVSDPTAAVLYSVILEQRTEMIVRSPNGALAHYAVPVSQQQLHQEIDTLRRLLEKRITDEYLTQAQKVYDLLIRPLAADLAAAQPKTLVFVSDGVLRNVPMAALHDGQQFLIQQYAIATAPSLSLTTGGPLDRSHLRALTLGLTVSRPPFAALTNVRDEAAGVQSILGGTKLLDQAFTVENLREKLKQQSYPIVHMATHGKFGVDADSTFLVAFDDRIRIDQIDTLLRTHLSTQPVELLTLSACQTAAGDDRTALGIAGVAVRAGVKTALATLWYINDESTVPLIETFYRQLRQPTVSRAEALRQAQLKLIEDPDYNHPAVWSPFVLVGNWL